MSELKIVREVMGNKLVLVFEYGGEKYSDTTGFGKSLYYLSRLLTCTIDEHLNGIFEFSGRTVYLIRKDTRSKEFTFDEIDFVGCELRDLFTEIKSRVKQVNAWSSQAVLSESATFEM